MDPVIVVGGGISGVAAARTIQAAGLPVVVLDRGRRLGGRMGVRTVDDRPVDIGASYFTVAEPAFEAVVRDWQQRGLAQPWTDTFHVYDGHSLAAKSGPVRWGTSGGLRSLVDDLAVGLDVRRQQVGQVGSGPSVDGQRAPAVVLAMPDPQAKRLLEPALAEEIEALADPYEPVMALTATWSRRQWADDIHGVFVNDDDALAWVADDGHRRGDHAPVLVAHSTPELAARFLDEPDRATEPMLASVLRTLAIPERPEHTSVHRWTFGKPARTRTEPFFLGSAGIGLCGDAWSEKPRVESAYLSGTAIGQEIVDRLR